MGFWFGSLVFLLLEAVGFVVIRFTGKQGNTMLQQTLWATTIICCWLMWGVIYIAQLHPLVHPILQG